MSSSAPFGYKPLGYQQVAVTSGAAVKPTITAGAALLVVVPSVAVNYRDDGTAPTTAIGMPLAANQAVSFTGVSSNLQFIAQSSSGNLNISAYGGT